MTRTSIFGYGSLLLVFLISIAALLPARSHYHFFADDLTLIKTASGMSSNSLAAFDIESKEKRRRPLYFCLLFAEKQLFNGNTQAYFAMHYFFHFLNTILLVWLAKRIGASPTAAFLAAILFFSSSSFYHIMIKLTGTIAFLGLFFFLLATLAWLRFLKGSRFAFLASVLFEQASLLSYELAVVFPLLAFCLTWLYEKDPQKRNRVIARFIPLLTIITLAVFFSLTTAFWHSKVIPQKVSFQSPQLILLKCATFIRMLIFPVFGKEKGILPFGILDSALVRLFPFITILLFSAVFLWKTKSFSALFGNTPKTLIATGISWIIITLLPVVPYPSHFVRATRYLLFPSIGIAIIAGFYLARFFALLSRAYPRAGLFLCVIIMGYYIAINSLSVSFQYPRAQNYLITHPNDDETKHVVKFFASPAIK